MLLNEYQIRHILAPLIGLMTLLYAGWWDKTRQYSPIWLYSSETSPNSAVRTTVLLSRLRRGIDQLKVVDKLVKLSM